MRGEDGSIHHPLEDTQTSARQKTVDLYAAQVLQRGTRVSVELIRAELAGRDLVCWCPQDEPCHGDFLVAIANSPAAAIAIPRTVRGTGDATSIDG